MKQSACQCCYFWKNRTNSTSMERTHNIFQNNHRTLERYKSTSTSYNISLDSCLKMGCLRRNNMIYYDDSHNSINACIKFLQCRLTDDVQAGHVESYELQWYQKKFLFHKATTQKKVEILLKGSYEVYGMSLLNYVTEHIQKKPWINIINDEDASKAASASIITLTGNFYWKIT